MCLFFFLGGFVFKSDYRMSLLNGAACEPFALKNVAKNSLILTRISRDSPRSQSYGQESVLVLAYSIVVAIELEKEAVVFLGLAHPSSSRLSFYPSLP